MFSIFAKVTYISPMVNPVREVSALVSKGCASSIALYLAQIPLIVAWLEGDVLDEEEDKTYGDGESIMDHWHPKSMPL